MINPSSLSSKTLGNVCSAQTASRGPHIDSVSIGFEQVHERANRVTNRLLELGVQPRGRVVILSKDSLASYEVLFGCAKSDAALVPSHWRLSTQELISTQEQSFIITDLRAKVIFVSEDYADKLGMVEQASLIPKHAVLMSTDHANNRFRNWLQHQTNEVVIWGQHERRTTGPELYARHEGESQSRAATTNTRF